VINWLETPGLVYLSLSDRRAFWDAEECLSLIGWTETPGMLLLSLSDSVCDLSGLQHQRRRLHIKHALEPVEDVLSNLNLSESNGSDEEGTQTHYLCCCCSQEQRFSNCAVSLNHCHALCHHLVNCFLCIQDGQKLE
jgi:hypothetical protein